MDDHDDLCLCFHVSVQKLRKFIRLNRPVRDSQLSECYGAGTGCGWCRPFLKSLFEAEITGRLDEQMGKLSAQEYALQRKDFRDQARANDKEQSG